MSNITSDDGRKLVVKVQDDGTVIRVVIRTCPVSGKDLLVGGSMVRRGMAVAGGQELPHGRA